MTKFIVIIMLVAATSHDKMAVRSKVKSLFNDNIELNVENITKVRKTATTNIVCYMIIADRFHLRDNMHVDLSNITLAKIDAWKDANLNNTNHVFVGLAETEIGFMTTNNLEYLP